MSGVSIVGALLRAHAPLIAAVPIESIKAGKLPDGVALPAILVRSISLVERRTVRRGEVVRSTERVAVAVRASSYREQRALIRQVRMCCAGQVGDLGGGAAVSIQSAGTGPDVGGPADSFEQTQDFLVSFNEAT